MQEKARKVAETEFRMKKAQEEARLREIGEEKIRRLEEDKRKEEFSVNERARKSSARNPDPDQAAGGRAKRRKTSDTC